MNEQRGDLSVGEQDDIIKEFVAESLDALDRMDRELIDLEKDPSNKPLLQSIFRTTHTIKGTCGFLGFNRLESLTHAGEHLLDKLREGSIVFSSEIATLLLRLADMTRSYLAQIATQASDEGIDCTELVQRLKKAAAESQATAQEPEAPPVIAKTAAPPKGEAPSHSNEPQAAEPTGTLAVTTAVEASPDTPLTDEERGAASEKQAGPAAGDARPGAAADTTLRVDVALLDKLMNLVGELVLARNQVLQFTKSINNSDFLGTSQRLNLITSELQESVMKTRMQPVSNVWSKFPRVVRDIARTCNKRVRIEMEGKDTELDKTIIEAIRDPLTHIVRNAVDHGIELPDIRLAKNKHPEGVLALRAFHEGGYVIIEISDDGAGLNLDKIRAKALQQGLHTTQQLAKMTDAELCRLVFAPGFSTAEAVTHISGRGVGMDVVRSNIEAVGGEVDIQSKPDEGCSIKIRIPLTLAIIPALIVSSGGQRFAIPQVSLLELVRVSPTDVGRAIESVDSARFYRLRGRLLPLVNLAQELQIRAPQSTHENGVNIVVVKADSQQFGLIVDAVHDTEEIVVKPLGKQLKDNAVFSGATIMGDGKVALIIDIAGLAGRARIDSHSEQTEHHTLTEHAQAMASGTTVSLLVVSLGDGRRLALPLGSVDRLERFSPQAIEHGNGHLIVQYRGGLLPIIDLGARLGAPCHNMADLLEVVVYGRGEDRVGFLVSDIVDIVEEELTLHYAEQQPDIAGTAVVHGCVTDVLDATKLAHHAHIGDTYSSALPAEYPTPAEMTL